MTARPAFGAKVESCLDGWSGEPGLEFDDEAVWHGYLRGLAGKRVRVVVSRETKGRTLPQNSWLWGAIYPAISDWSGHTVDEIHEVMKELHGVKRLMQMPGGQAGRADTGAYNLAIRVSTAEYTTDEFSEYVERVRAWAAMQGLNIPDPGRCV